MRIAELRRVGTAPLESTVRMSIFGTEGSFEQQVGYASWATINWCEPPWPLDKPRNSLGNVDLS